jgi:hypothetical protein
MLQISKDNTLINKNVWICFKIIWIILFEGLFVKEKGKIHIYLIKSINETQNKLNQFV